MPDQIKLAENKNFQSSDMNILNSHYTETIQ